VSWRDRRRILLRRAIGATLFGALAFIRRPEQRLAWGGPFNGQAYRCLLFAALIERLRPVAIVETGTYLGTTTEWIAAFQVPVFTCESGRENFGFARTRLAALSNVTVTPGDSRTFLRGLLADRLRPANDATVIFYLDAHWNSDLPLAEEVDLVFRTCARAVVLIDDFEVPGDPGYGFDAYGPDLTLNASYIASAVQRYRLASFYPSTPSSVETGKRRGCVLLCSEGVADALRALPLLRCARSDAARVVVPGTHGLPRAR
jgi:hypothetical protein